MIDPLTYAGCQQLLSTFWNALDNRHIDRLMNLVTDDIRWQRERIYEGRDAVRAAIEARPENLRIRHMMTNLIVSERDDGGFTAEFILLPVFAITEADAAPPYSSDMIVNVAEFQAGLTRDGDALRIDSISFAMMFTRSEPQRA